MKNLVIVESPAKAKTIERILGKDYKVTASFGHVRDLPKNSLGVDTDQDFKPQYVIPTKAKKTVSMLKSMISKVDNVYLATDLDREGEAIAWHIVQATKPKKSLTIKRVVFPSITKQAVESGMEQAREINMDLVDAQQARRVLDRLVGYKLSPLLWKKIFKGLSAGRVQSVALRLIVDREREIEKFKPEEYWTVEADFSKQKNSAKFRGKLAEVNRNKYDPTNEKEAKQFEKSLEKADYQVDKIISKEKNRNPHAPFITSTLQQEAYKKLGFSAKKTMTLAQKLYEGVDIAGKHMGLITYMRTDSFNLSGEAVEDIRNLISKEYGKKYLPAKPVFYKKKSKLAQEAHEAIRVTYPAKIPEKIRSYLEDDMFRLYELIWKRTISCQMLPAKYDTTQVDIIGNEGKNRFLFRTNGIRIVFQGFLLVWDYAGAQGDDVILPQLKEKEDLDLKELFFDQHFTQPPARFTEATLVKELEKNGVGRPSTYATIMSTIQSRNYVEKKEGKFHPLEVGMMVSDFLVKYFPEIVNVGFTAEMEKDLDIIALGKKKWVPVIRAFYEPFISNIADKEKNIAKGDIVGEEKTDEKCPNCGKALQIKYGRYGKFLACTGFPDCKFTKPLNLPKEQQEIAEHADPCEKCGGAMVVKQGRFGSFLACNNYPQCKNIRPITNTALSNIDCPHCQEGKLVQKRSKRGKIFYACNRYPDCKVAVWNEPTNEKCKICGFIMTKNKKGELDCEQCKKDSRENSK